MQKFIIRKKVLKTYETVIEAASFKMAEGKVNCGFVKFYDPDDLVDTKISHKVEYIGEVDDDT